MRASYERAIGWIADNDEPGEYDIDTMASLISVVLVADLWGKDPARVARDVVNRRKRAGNPPRRSPWEQRS